MEGYGLNEHSRDQPDRAHGDPEKVHEFRAWSGGKGAEDRQVRVMLGR